MDERPLDLRIQKTYKSLIEAFTALLNEKRFESITVNELCDRAMVRRATFYKHFGDKYEFFTFMIKQIQQRFYSSYRSVFTSESSVVPYIAIAEYMLDFLEEYKPLVISVMQSSALPILIDITFEQIVRNVTTFFQNDAQNGVELIRSPELLAHAYTGALIYIAKWWITNKNQISKEEMIEQISNLIERLQHKD